MPSNTVTNVVAVILSAAKDPDAARVTETARTFLPPIFAFLAERP